jgi:hypothetical protein
VALDFNRGKMSEIFLYDLHVSTCECARGFAMTGRMVVIQSIFSSKRMKFRYGPRNRLLEPGKLGRKIQSTDEFLLKFDVCLVSKKASLFAPQQRSFSGDTLRRPSTSSPLEELIVEDPSGP